METLKSRWWRASKLAFWIDFRCKQNPNSFRSLGSRLFWNIREQRSHSQNFCAESAAVLSHDIYLSAYRNCTCPIRVDWGSPTIPARFAAARWLRSDLERRKKNLPCLQKWASGRKHIHAIHAQHLRSNAPFSSINSLLPLTLQWVANSP